MTTFETPTPLSVTIDIVGDARITASDRTDTVVDVRPRNPSKAGDVKAAEEAVVECRDGRLLVRTPKHRRRFTPFGGGERVTVTIDLPTGSAVEASTDMGDLTTEGELGACRLETAMGDIRLDHTGALHATTAHGNVVVDRVVGEAEVTTSSGDVRLGDLDGVAVIKSSNGDTAVADVTGDLRVKAANGDITVGRAHRSVVAKTANGDVRIRDVSHGAIVMETAKGEIEVGIPEGVAAWLDVSTSFGTVRNTLGAADGPGPSEGTVEVRARSSFGDIVIGRSTADASR
ncbi:MAG TPA: DUF4097 family beta strand repeat-containing protein [Iamia sp.]